MKKINKSSVLMVSLIGLLVIMVLSIIFLPELVNAQCQQQLNYPRAQGLISAQSFSAAAKFGNLIKKCAVDTNSAYAEIPDYSDLKSTFYTKAKDTDGKKQVLNNETLNVASDVQNQKLYLRAGNLTIPAGSYTTTAVLFVDGDVNITGNLQGSLTGGWVILAGGNINISPTVTRVDAILISSGTICTAAATAACDVTTASQLVVNGSLVSLNSNMPIKFARTLTNNSTTPAELINQQPKYLAIMNNLFTQTLSITSEDTSYGINLPAGSATPIPTPVPSSTACADGQYLAEYYSNLNYTGAPILSRCENAPINQNFGSGGPTAGVVDNFTGRWTGRFNFPTAGNYTFSATTDDGVRVWLDGNQIINDWNGHAPTLNQVTVAVNAGLHEIRVEYFEGGGNAQISFDFSSASAGFNPNTPGNLNNGLVSYWKLDDVGNINDAKNLNNGSAVGTSSVGGKILNARSFNGTSDFISAPIGSYFGQNNPLTVSAWVYVTSGATGPIFGVTSEPSSNCNPNVGLCSWNMPFLSVASNTVYGWIYGQSQISRNVGSNQWHMVTLTYNSAGGGSSTFYVDGTAVGNATGPYNSSGASNYFTTYIPGVKPSGVGNLLNTPIDEVGIWSRALSAQEVATLYQNGTGNSYNP